MSETAERVFYECGNVRVTSARFQVGAQTWAMNAVSAVRYRKVEPSRFFPGFLLAMGVLFLFLGAAAFSGMTGRPVAVALAGFGLALVAGGGFVFSRLRPMFSVVLSTSGGEMPAIENTNAGAVEPVVRALNDALVSRG